jgi:hypothetical protein
MSGRRTSVHLGRCPSLLKIFDTINQTVGFTPDKNRNVQRKALDTLFCHPHADTPQYIGNLYLIAWRLILTESYQLHFDEERPVFDEERAYSIFQRTLERYTILALAKAHRTRPSHHADQRKERTTPPPNDYSGAQTSFLAPSFKWTKSLDSP